MNGFHQRRLGRIAVKAFNDERLVEFSHPIITATLCAVPTVAAVMLFESYSTHNKGIKYQNRDLVGVSVRQTLTVAFTDGESVTTDIQWGSNVNVVDALLGLDGVPATDMEAAEASVLRATNSLIQRNFGGIEKGEGNALHLIPAGTYTTCSDLTFESTSFTMRLHDAATDKVLVEEKFPTGVKLPHYDYGVSLVGFGRLSPVGGFIQDAIRSVVATHQRRVLQHEQFSVNQVNHFNNEANHVIAHFGRHAEHAKALYRDKAPAEGASA